MVPALQGRDIIARAKTGTGKTLAFGIPIIKRLTEQAGDYSEFRSLFNIPFVYFVISRGSVSLVQHKSYLINPEIKFGLFRYLVSSGIWLVRFLKILPKFWFRLYFGLVLLKFRISLVCFGMVFENPKKFFISFNFVKISDKFGLFRYLVSLLFENPTEVFDFGYILL